MCFPLRIRSNRATAFLISLAARVVLAVPEHAYADPFRLANDNTKDHTYQVTGTATKDNTSMGFSITIPVPAQKSVTIGGPNSGLDSLKGFETKNVTVQVLGTAKTDSLFFPDPFPPPQTALVLGDVTNTSDVFSFFDFSKIGYTELIADVAFDFAGFLPNGAPILDLSGTSTPITDSQGNLFPQYQFTGPTEALAEVSSLPSIPEPTSIALLTIGLVGLFGYRRCRPGRPK